MKRLENEAFRTAFSLLWPLVFYELCTEVSAWLCAFCGITDSLFVTGAGALLAFPFLAVAYQRKKESCCGDSRFPGADTELEHKRKRKGRVAAGSAWAAFAGAGACLFLNMVLQGLLSPSGGWESTREVVYRTSPAVRLLVTVVLAPLAEKLVFRGLFRLELRQHMRTVSAALVTSVLFGLYHGNLSQGVYAFCLSLCLELVCAWSGLLIPAVAMHAGANAAAAGFTASSAFAGRSGACARFLQLLPDGESVLRPQAAIVFAAVGACIMAVSLYKTKEVFTKI